MPGADPDQIGITVNEHEGTVLGMIARWPPLTRYQLLKAFERSPISSYNTSKGSLYPLVGRMIARGFIETETRQGPRESEVLSLSPLGREALNDWIMRIGPQHGMVHDPLQVRILALGELPAEDRVRWVVNAKGLLLGKKDELSNYHGRLTVPFNEIVHSFGAAVIDAKLRWLDRLLLQLVDEQDPARRVGYSGDGDGKRENSRGKNSQ